MAYLRGVPYIFRSHSGFEVDMVTTVEAARMDEFVVMRYAEMTPQTRARAEKRAVQRHAGNTGCEALCRKHGVPGFGERLSMLVAADRESLRGGGGMPSASAVAPLETALRERRGDAADTALPPTRRVTR
jgi:hypothetical protein